MESCSNSTTKLKVPYPATFLGNLRSYRNILDCMECHQNSWLPNPRDFYTFLRNSELKCILAQLHRHSIKSQYIVCLSVKFQVDRIEILQSHGQLMHRFFKQIFRRVLFQVSNNIFYIYVPVNVAYTKYHSFHVENQLSAACKASGPIAPWRQTFSRKQACYCTQPTFCCAQPLPPFNELDITKYC